IYSKEVEDYQRFGVNVLEGETIVDMVEKPDTPISRLAQVGLYYLKDGAGFIGAIEATIAAGETVKGEYYLPSVFMRMIGAGHKFKAPEIDAWLDCGKPETLLETNRYLLKGRHHVHGEVQDSILLEPVHVGYGAVIRNSIVGPNVSVAAGSVIENSVISDSIINTDNIVSHLILEHSLLGDSVNLLGSPRRMNIGDHSHIVMDQ
ncbi:MAG: sugar phosphate nucleotidyltransferase, partial [Thermodesulfobacteriota bacterium]|nr:sugar phosphate nucleotidyltransferase [Thermodesulfobacteriota bacterium]